MDYLITLLQGFWVGIQVLVGIHLFVPMAIYLIYVIVKKRPKSIDTPVAADYGIIVTAYGQLAGVEHVIDSLLKLNYTNYLIYVVADNCGASKLHIDDPRVVVLYPENVLASNTRSHFYAIQRFQREHDRLTVIDSDNLVHSEYLNELNGYFDRGYEAVQGVRQAKNMDTSLACLDAARDIYYHFYDGKLLFEVGSSATLAGSGMAFTVSLYRDCLGDKDIVGAGFDKVLQFEIVKRGFRIAYAEEAKVYDEKTTHSAQLVKQRSRWINTWFKYFGFGFALIGRGLRRFDFNQLLFGFILLRPPLFIFLFLSVLFFLINLLMMNFFAAGGWLVGLSLFVIGFFVALDQSNAPAAVYNSLKNTPRFVYYQLISLLNVRRANKISVATKHSVIRKIDDMQ